MEADGCWIAAVADLPGVLAYGATRERAIANVEALALRVIAERLENEEDVPDIAGLFLVAARVNGNLQKPAKFWRRCCALAGVSNGEQHHIKHWSATVGLTMCLPFTITTKSSQLCCLVSQNTLD